MSSSLPRLELGTTKLFSVTYSTAPTTSAYLAIHAGSGAATLVHCAQGVSSDSGLTWGAHFTIPASSQVVYTYTWVASFGAGPVVVRGQFQGIATRPL